MIEVTIFLFICVFLALKPVVIPYLAVLHLFFIGLMGTELNNTLKISLGSVNVFPLDLIYVLAVLFALIYLVNVFLLDGRLRKTNTLETRRMTRIIMIYVIFFVGKLVNGFMSGMPLDSLLRLFASDTQVLYFFMPIVVYRNVGQLGRLLRFVVFLSLVFPICQPFLVHSEGTKFIMGGQGTFRLGHGDANVLLALGIIALFCWEKKKQLIFLPLTGIMMLAHRSAYIAIVISFMALSFLKGKKLKTLVLMGTAGIVVIGVLAALQSFTGVGFLDRNIDRAGETFKSTGTTVARANVYGIAFEEFQKRPFTGLDYQEHQDAIRKGVDSPRDFNITHPHNFILSAIMTTGAVGTILLFIIIFSGIKCAYKVAKTGVLKMEGTYLFSAILFFVIFSSMNTTMETLGYVLWFICGVPFWFFNEYKSAK